jgi:hypothetical protein
MVAATSNFEGMSAETLVAFGALFGLSHVLSGPDHLFALAVISSSTTTTTTTTTTDECNDEEDRDEQRLNEIERGSSSSSSSSTVRKKNDEIKRQRAENVQLGLSWALGHSFGLAIVVSIFYALKRELDIERVSEYGDKIVGFTMILISLFALRSIWKMRKREVAERTHVIDFEVEGAGDKEAHLGDDYVLEIEDLARVLSEKKMNNKKKNEKMEPLIIAAAPVVVTSIAAIEKEAVSGSHEHEQMHKDGMPHVHHHHHHHHHDKDDDDEDHDHDDEDHEEKVKEDDASKEVYDKEEEEEEEVKKNTETFRSSTTAAFIVGTIHGISGVTGVIGVLPGVVLRDSSKSASFVCAFFVSSIVSMTTFSLIFGEGLRKAREFGGRKFAILITTIMNAFFAVGAFGCGAAWLYLSFSGEGINV